MFTKDNIMVWPKGKPFPKEMREKISKKLTGRTLSLEHRMKIGEANKRRSPEIYKILSEKFKGRKFTKETRKRISQSQLERKEEISQMMKKYWETADKEKIMGPNSPNWKGGIRVSGNYAYRYAPNHPNVTVDNIIPESHYVWEKHHNKLVPRGYVIHHRDFNSLNNDISNLLILTQSEHMKLHIKIRQGKKAEQCRP